MLLTPIRTVSDQRLSCDFTVSHFRVGHIASLGLRRGDFVFGSQSRRGHLGNGLAGRRRSAAMLVVMAGVHICFGTFTERRWPSPGEYTKGYSGYAVHLPTVRKNLEWRVEQQDAAPFFARPWADSPHQKFRPWKTIRC